LTADYGHAERSWIEQLTTYLRMSRTCYNVSSQKISDSSETQKNFSETARMLISVIYCSTADMDAIISRVDREDHLSTHASKHERLSHIVKRPENNLTAILVRR